MPPGTDDLITLVVAGTVMFAVMLTITQILMWIEDAPARRRRRDWDRHCKQAMSLPNNDTWPDAFTWTPPADDDDDKQNPIVQSVDVRDYPQRRRPVTDASIRAAHQRELQEGSESRHPSRRTGGAR